MENNMQSILYSWANHMEIVSRIKKNNPKYKMQREASFRKNKKHNRIRYTRHRERTGVWCRKHNR